MKKFIFALSVVIIFISCETRVVEVNKNEELPIWKEVNEKPIVQISKSQYELISTFRPTLRDVAMYVLTHKEACEADSYHFKCGKFEFWIANGYNYFKLDAPMELGLSHNEKQYFWDIYNEYRYKKARLYRYEEDVKIEIK